MKNVDVCNLVLLMKGLLGDDKETLDNDIGCLAIFTVIRYPISSTLACQVRNMIGFPGLPNLSQ